MTTLLWDQHTCLPLHTETEIDPLTRYQYDGGTVLSVNAGYSPHSFNDAVALLHHYRAAIDAHPGLDLADTLDEVDAATRAGRIAVVFDLEDSRPLDDDLENVRNLATLGVRTMLPTYNNANRAGSGCLDRTDGGLTAWGHAVVAELNAVGIFLGPNTPTLDAMTRHLEYAVELVGVEHVGVSTDFSFDTADFNDELQRNPHLFNDSYTRWGPIQWMPPETFVTLGEHLRGRGWRSRDIQAVLGGNFYRVAQRTWRT